MEISYAEGHLDELRYRSMKSGMDVQAFQVLLNTLTSTTLKFKVLVCYVLVIMEGDHVMLVMCFDSGAGGHHSGGCHVR